MARTLISSLWNIFQSNSSTKRRSPRRTRLTIESCEQRLMLSASALIAPLHPGGQGNGSDSDNNSQGNHGNSGHHDNNHGNQGNHVGLGNPIATAGLIELGQSLLTLEAVKNENMTFLFSAPGVFGSTLNISGKMSGTTATETITWTLPNGRQWVETGTITVSTTGVIETISVTSPISKTVTETGNFTMTTKAGTIVLNGNVKLTEPSGKSLTTPVQVTIDPAQKSETLTFTAPNGKKFTLITDVVTTKTGEDLQIKLTGPNGKSAEVEFPIPTNPLI